MKFEFDEAKSRHNKEKHGIDFVDAQKLWFNERYNVTKLDYEGKRYGKDK